VASAQREPGLERSGALILNDYKKHEHVGQILKDAYQNDAALAYIHCWASWRN